MAQRRTDPAVLASALAGYRGEPFAGLHTSTLHAAHCIGKHMQATGRSEPRDVRPHRGDTMHCNGMLFRLDWRHVRCPTITREA